MKFSCGTRLGAHTGKLFSAAFLSVALLQGCSTFGGAEKSTSVGDSADVEPDPDLDLIAQNLVFTLAQIPGLNPLSTTVQLNEPKTEFGQQIVRRIRDAGYGIQTVQDDRGGNFLRYSIVDVTSETTRETRYDVAIGRIAAERAFQVNDGDVVPVSELRVTGTEPVDGLMLLDDIFGLDPDAPVSTVAFDVDMTPTVIDLASDINSNPAPRERTALAVSRPFEDRLRQNLYSRIESNYADIFQAYDDLDSHTLVFPNDSLLLGEAEKAVIASYAERANPDTDIVSVVGCSHGNTNIQNGNRVLAIGRANRVKEALLYAGLEATQVLDEGCWAEGKFHKVFPKRGVVMTLKRRRS